MQLKLKEINPFLRNIIKTGRVMYCYYSPMIAGDCRIFYVVTGKLRVDSGGVSYSIPAGGLIYIPAGTAYTLISESADTSIYIFNFDFTQKASGRKEWFSPKELSLYQDEIIYNEKFEETDLFDKPLFVKDAAYLLSKIEEVYRLYTNKKVFFEEYCSCVLKHIIFRMAEAAMYGYSDTANRIFEQILNYIHEHYGEHSLMNEQICKIVGYHPYYVNKIVKKITGITLHQFLDRYRAERAAELLLYSCLSVEEVAEQTGFSSTNAFRLSFKKIYGINPSKYRRKN